MTATKLLTFEALFHGELALLLLTMPQLTLRIIGWAVPPTMLWPRLLGGVMLGIALAMAITLAGWAGEGASGGIGLAAEIPIKLTMSFVLFSMLYLGPEQPTKRGAVFTAGFAAALLALALFEVAYL